LSSYRTFLLRKYRGLLYRAHSLLKDSLHSQFPREQAAFLAENYSDLFEEIESVSTQVQVELCARSLDVSVPTSLSGDPDHQSEPVSRNRKQMGPGQLSGLQIAGGSLSNLDRTYLRHSLLLVDAVDRNIAVLKDRGLKDVFRDHVGEHIRAFLRAEDR
jgi:hypothetical protein